ASIGWPQPVGPILPRNRLGERLRIEVTFLRRSRAAGRGGAYSFSTAEKFFAGEIAFVLLAAPANYIDVVDNVAAATRPRNPVIATWRALVVAPVPVAHGDAAVGARQTEILRKAAAAQQASPLAPIAPGAGLLADLTELPAVDFTRCRLGRLA